MTSLIDILAGSVGKAALGTRALAQRVLNLTGARPFRMVRD